MDGNYFVLMRDALETSKSRSLVVYLVLSIFFHLLLLTLPVLPLDGRSGVGQAGTGQLQVSFSHLRGVVKDLVPQAVHRTPSREVDPAPRGLSEQGLLAVLPEKEAELISEIDFEITDPRVRGFMILRLQIATSGQVSASEVIYSDLSANVTDYLVGRFVSAKFKPAEKNGQALDTAILLKVDVE